MRRAAPAAVALLPLGALSLGRAATALAAIAPPRPAAGLHRELVAFLKQLAAQPTASTQKLHRVTEVKPNGFLFSGT